ncbi:MAG: hypothetical protein ACOC90_10305, partial [Bacteroidota bacterium]
WIFDLYDEIGSGDLPEGLADFLEGGPDIQHWGESIEKIQKQSTSVQKIIHEMVELLAWEIETDTSAHSIVYWISLLEELQDTGKLYSIVQYNNIQKKTRKNRFKPNNRKNF